MIAAKQLNNDRDNIEYIDLDLYQYPHHQIKTTDAVSVFLVDAGHTYDNVIDDVNRIFDMNCENDCYIIFDDYGMNRWQNDVRRAIDQAIDSETLEIIQEIGYPTGHDFGQNRILLGPEGLITKIKWNK